MSRESNSIDDVKLKYPLRQNQLLQTFQEGTNRSKSNNKMVAVNNNSVENFKIENRSATPQKIMFQAYNPVNNLSTNFQMTHNPRLQNLSFNVKEDGIKTSDNFYRSPQHRNTHNSTHKAFNSANTSLNFEPIKSPITFAD
jgi:hypothetical protein